MCGIVGYVGLDAAPDGNKFDHDAYKVVIEGLRRQEYRGYDSAGVAPVSYTHLDVYKRQADQEAEGLRWSRAPARGTAAQDLRIQPGRPVIRAYEETIRRNRGSERRADRSRGRAH